MSEEQQGTASSPLRNAPNCMRCTHFYVTWDARFPRGCRYFGFKTKELPSISVFKNTGSNCPVFTPRSTQNG